jgi:hypothetical protein
LRHADSALDFRRLAILIFERFHYFRCCRRDAYAAASYAISIFAIDFTPLS